MKKTITVDFDETLATSETGAWPGVNLVPVQRIIDYVKEQHKKGYEINIVTFRNWNNKSEIETFCKAHKIPVKHIVCTEGKNKVPFIQNLRSDLHIDDSVEVCTLCVMAGIEVLLVDWGQENFNSTAQFLPKI